MASYKNFQSQQNKYSTGVNISKKMINLNKASEKLTKNEKLMNGIAIWTAYYRDNPHIFVKDYLGIDLLPFQEILLYRMFHDNHFMFFAARGLGKTWLTAVFSVSYAILYPGSTIVVSAGQISQSLEIIDEKIDELFHKSAMLRREISKISTNSKKPRVDFHCGSKIIIKASNQGARGARGNVLVLDEFRLIDNEIIKTVLKHFLTTPRQPQYLRNPEYANNPKYQEPNKEIYLSSCWYKFHWSWEKAKAYLAGMLQDKGYFLCSLPYQLSIRSNLLLRQSVLNDMSEDDFDPISWQIEMGALFYGENANSYFKLQEMNKCRTLTKAFYPPNDNERVDYKSKKTKKILPKQNGEVRIIGVDLAFMPGEKNDNTIFTFMRLIPKDKKYIRHVSFIKSLNGQITRTQTIELKRLFYDLDCDYVAMDCSGSGLGLYDDCLLPTIDEVRDKEYPAWCSMNQEGMIDRKYDNSAVPLIYDIKGNAELNHKIITALKRAFENNTIALLVSDIEYKNGLQNKKEFLMKPSEEKADELKAFVQTNALINEIISLETPLDSKGRRSVKEANATQRKDRYSSIAYANWFANILENDLLDDNDIEDEYEAMKDYIFV